MTSKNLNGHEKQESAGSTVPRCLKIYQKVSYYNVASEVSDDWLRKFEVKKRYQTKVWKLVKEIEKSQENATF